MTVLNLSFYPDRPAKLSDLKIDLKEFERHIDPGSLSSASYTNDADGIVLTVDTSENTVIRFGFFPESRFNRLMCKDMSS